MSRLYLVLALIFLLFVIACDSLKLDKGETVDLEKIIPEKVSVDIPSSLNGDGFPDQTINVEGDEIYNYVRNYINLADYTTWIVENSYNRIRAIETPGIHEFSYTGTDGKTKNISIQENYTDTITKLSWDYYLEIYNGTFADLALKAWWNTNPYEQKILFKPSSLNTNEMINHPNALVEINYKTESASSPYEKSLFVAITGLTVDDEISFAPENILITIGQNDNILDIIGASNNPNVALLDNYYRGGRNWSFFAKVNTAENIAAMQLALPPSFVESTDNLFTDYSAKQVILDEIKAAYPGNETLSESELFELAEINGSLFESPGFFNEDGFLAAGSPPSVSYVDLVDFEGFTPFVPVFIRDYEIKLSISNSTEEENNK